MDGDAPPYIAVVGSIGVGKSGLTERLAKAIGARQLLEEVARNPFFDCFYERPDLWAFKAQLAFVSQALRRQIAAQPAGPVVQDRVVWESTEVFAPVLLELGELSDDEASLLAELGSHAFGLPRQPSLLLYLRAPIEAALERIERRGREAERGIDAAYLGLLEAGYEHFLAGWEGCAVVEIDTASTDLRTESGLTELVETIRR